MLFSHPDVASLMSRSFECAWESVRSVPRVAIDFGNGHTLERTLHGNIVTYLCTSAGEVYDLIPGLVDAEEYVRRLDQALRLERALPVGEATLIPWSDAGSPGTEGARTFTGVLTPSSPPVDPWRATVMRWHEAMVARSETGVVGTLDPIPVFDGSKMRVERRLDLSLQPPLAAADVEALRRDTHHNRELRYPLASQVLLERPFARPRELAGEVYRRVLDVDLDDPYLGLAPAVLGGEPGRSSAARKRAQPGARRG